jgi:hypothetical protein
MDASENSDPQNWHSTFFFGFSAFTTAFSIVASTIRAFWGTVGAGATSPVFFASAAASAGPELAFFKASMRFFISLIG